MKSYLFVWNPTKWPWHSLEADLQHIRKYGWRNEPWSCGNTKSIEPDDRIFLVKVGQESKGVFGSGYASTTPYSAPHWSGDGRDAFYVDVKFDTILHPFNDKILTVNHLSTGILADQYSWTPQASGISLRDDIAEELERIWFTFNNSKPAEVSPYTIPEEELKTYREGKLVTTVIKRYERNREARNACLQHHGYRCKVCNMSFEETYGQVGKDFIHVHHKIPISEIAKEHLLNPVEALVPVCPNCHAMIRQVGVTRALGEVKTMLKLKLNI